MADIVVMQVDTGALNGAPSVTAVSQCANLRLNAVERLSKTAFDNAALVQTDNDRTFNNPREPNDVISGGQVYATINASTIQLSVAEGKAYLTGYGTKAWNAQVVTQAVSDGQYMLTVSNTGALSLVDFDAFADDTHTNLIYQSAPILWLRIKTLGGVKSIVQMMHFGSRAHDNSSIIDWSTEAASEGSAGSQYQVVVHGGVHHYSGGRKVVPPQKVDVRDNRSWLSGAPQTIAGGAGNVRGMRYMYLRPVNVNGVAPVPTDKGIICKVMLDTAAPNAQGFHPTQADLGVFYPYFGSLPCVQDGANPSVSVLAPGLMHRTEGVVHIDVDPILFGGAFIGKTWTVSGTTAEETYDLTDAELPKTAKTLGCLSATRGVPGGFTAKWINRIEGSINGVVTMMHHDITSYAGPITVTSRSVPAVLRRTSDRSCVRSDVMVHHRHHTVDATFDSIYPLGSEASRHSAGSR